MLTSLSFKFSLMMLSMFPKNTSDIIDSLVNSLGSTLYNVSSINLSFCFLRTNLSKFKNFIAGVNDRDWTRAAEEMMDSRWATQVGDRAIRLRNQILTLV